MARKGRHIADFDDVASVETTVLENMNEIKLESDNIQDISVVKDEEKKNIDLINTIDDAQANVKLKELDIVKKEPNTNNEDSIDVIDDILNNNKTKSTRVQRGLYLDSDIDKVLNSLFKKGGKGSKSDILNSVLKKEFKRKGLL